MVLEDLRSQKPDAEVARGHPLQITGPIRLRAEVDAWLPAVVQTSVISDH